MAVLVFAWGRPAVRFDAQECVITNAVVRVRRADGNYVRAHVSAERAARNARTYYIVTGAPRERVVRGMKREVHICPSCGSEYLTKCRCDGATRELATFGVASSGPRRGKSKRGKEFGVSYWSGDGSADSERAWRDTSAEQDPFPDDRDDAIDLTRLCEVDPGVRRVPDLPAGQELEF